MTIAINVQHMAVQLVAMYGVEARTFVALKASDMLKEGKLYERRTWRRVKEAVDELLARDRVDNAPFDLQLSSRAFLDERPLSLSANRNF